MPIDDSEWQDYVAVLREYDLSEADFEVTSVEDSLPVGGISPTTGKVAVRSKKTGAERIYRAGHVTVWVVQFDKDLRAGCFVSSGVKLPTE